jgi:hypothetical protein
VNWPYFGRRRAMAATTHLKLVQTDPDTGITWLDLARLPAHDEHVAFTGLDGVIRLDVPESFDVFRFDGVLYEVQGVDRPRKRAWVESVREIGERAEPAGLSRAPIEGAEGIGEAA